MKHLAIVVLLLLPYFGFSQNVKDTIPRKTKHVVKPKKTTKKSETVKVVAEDPRIAKIRNEMGWDWMQEKGGNIWEAIAKSAIPSQDPITKLFTGPTKIHSINSNSFSEDIDFYFLEALRTYVFSPASNPIGEIWNYQTNDAVRKDYGDYLLDFHDDAFWNLSITASIDNRGGDLQQSRQALLFIKANKPGSITVAKEAFNQGKDVLAMFALMYGQRHNMDACTTLRATYRDHKKAFIALVKSF